MEPVAVLSAMLDAAAEGDRRTLAGLRDVALDAAGKGEAGLGDPDGESAARVKARMADAVKKKLSGDDIGEAVRMDKRGHKFCIDDTSGKHTACKPGETKGAKVHTHQQVAAHIAKLKQGEVTADHVVQAAKMMATLTVADLRQVNKALQAKAGASKSHRELVDKIKERVLGVAPGGEDERKRAAQKQLDMGQAPLRAGARPEKDESVVDAAIRWARSKKVDFRTIKSEAEKSAGKGRTREQFLGRFGAQLDAAGKKAVGDYYDAVKGAEKPAEPKAQPKPAAPTKTAPAFPPDNAPRTFGKGQQSVHEAMMKAGKSPLPERQYLALDHYTSAGFKEINDGLRAGKDVPEAADLDAAIASAPPPPPGTTVYRGLEFMDDEERDDFLKTLTGVIDAPAYTSASLDPGRAAAFTSRMNGAGVLLEIAAKRGLYVPAANAAAGDAHKNTDIDIGEHELLLPRGAKFRVIGSKEIEVAAKPHGRGEGTARVRVYQLEQL